MPQQRPAAGSGYRPSPAQWRPAPRGLAPGGTGRDLPAALSGGVAAVPARPAGGGPRTGGVAQPPRRTLQPGPDPGGGGPGSPGGGQGHRQGQLSGLLWRTGQQRRLWGRSRLAAPGQPQLHRAAQVPAGGGGRQWAVRHLPPLSGPTAELPRPLAAVLPAAARRARGDGVQAKRYAPAPPAQAPDTAAARGLAVGASPLGPGSETGL